MVRDIIEKNEKVNPNADLLKKLKSLIPGVIAKDGSIDADAIRYWAERATGDSRLVTEERETFNFLGKDYARLLYALDTETIIIPDEDNNKKTENKDSENLYLSGDNLEVLKHLRRSYEGEVKCIYIDPPYNTGSDDFVYNDSFDFTEKDLKEKLGLDDDAQVEKIMNMRKRGSRSHAAWLTFMYPRLKLARDLLKDDGVIFISIDDNEQANLKILCDEIFGEENFIANLIWKSKSGGANDSEFFAVDHEYIFAYAKNISEVKIKIDKKAEVTTSYNRHDENGDYALERLDKQSIRYSPSGDYEIIGPDGKKYRPLHKDPKHPNATWRWGKKQVQEHYNELVFENGCVYTKNYKKDGAKARSLLIEDRFGRTRTGKTDCAELFDLECFSSPKPYKLITHLQAISSNDNETILDFFSGSATTAQATFEINVEEKANRKFILVQIPENLDESLKRTTSTRGNTVLNNAITILDSIHKPHTLDQIGMERIRRAAAKIKEEHPDCKCDLGFKHFTIQKMDKNDKRLELVTKFDKSLAIGDSTILKKFGVKTVLTTWMVDDGFTFNANIEKIDLGGYSAYRIKDDAKDYLYLIDEGIDSKHIKMLFKKYDEDKNFKPKHIALFGYSFGMTTLDTLKANIKNVDGINIHTEMRY